MIYFYEMMPILILLVLSMSYCAYFLLQERKCRNASGGILRSMTLGHLIKSLGFLSILCLMLVLAGLFFPPDAPDGQYLHFSMTMLGFSPAVFMSLPFRTLYKEKMNVKLIYASYSAALFLFVFAAAKSPSDAGSFNDAVFAICAICLVLFMAFRFRALYLSGYWKRYSVTVLSLKSNMFYIGVFAISLCIVTAFYLLPVSLLSLSVFCILLSALVFFICHEISSGTITQESSYKSISLLPDEMPKEVVVNDGVLQEIQERLVAYFNKEKPYLDPDLKIGDVALGIFTNKTYLSKVLNLKMHTNFNKFVNSYRISMAMELYRNNPSLKIGELCTRSGFNNMPSFNHSFRMVAGCSPSEWCKKVRSQICVDGVISGEDNMNGRI